MMFGNPYIRLSIWYGAIITVISLAFSLWVYSGTMNEVRASLSGPYIVRLQQQYGSIPRQELLAAIEKQYADSQGRIIFNLILLNIAVLAVGGVGSYMLARRTMRPIEDALEAQNRFTADASHELRTPLAAMKTEIEVALRGTGARKEEMRELLKSNLEEIDRMSNLTEGLLTLARPGGSLQLSAVRADKIVREVVERLKPLADAKKISIQSEIIELKLMAEPKSLAAIISVLVDNAIKYSGEHTTITISTKRKDGHGFIMVSDNGPGIPSSDMPYIFDRFYRADASRTKQRVVGNGLGLSIAQKLAGALNGVIQVQCTQGKGCTFTFRAQAILPSNKA